MITFLSGTPGAGKTLHAIEKLLLPLVGTTVKQLEDGVEVEYPRTIYTNIRGLMIDHELIDESATGGLRNWHEWAKPGAVIVFDEVQKVWPPRPNGSKVPSDIEHLETHRHMGVDFILISQHPTLIDGNICKLAGRHLHVRRVGNMRLAIVYEWDHVSRSLLFAKAFTKAPWRYDKKVFKLYKSAELHTKQPRKLPGLVWFLLAGLLAMVVLAPTFYGRMQDRIGSPQAAKAAGVQKRAPASLFSGPEVPPVVAGPAAVVAKQEERAFAGCASMAGRCTCFGVDGAPVAKEPGFCAVLTRGPVDQPPHDLKGLFIPEEERHRYELAAVEQDPAAAEAVLAQQGQKAEAGKPAPHASARTVSGALTVSAGPGPILKAN